MTDSLDGPSVGPRPETLVDALERLRHCASDALLNLECLAGLIDPLDQVNVTYQAEYGIRQFPDENEWKSLSTLPRDYGYWKRAATWQTEQALDSVAASPVELLGIVGSNAHRVGIDILTRVIYAAWGVIAPDHIRHLDLDGFPSSEDLLSTASRPKIAHAIWRVLDPTGSRRDAGFTLFDRLSALMDQEYARAVARLDKRQAATSGSRSQSSLSDSEKDLLEVIAEIGPAGDRRQRSILDKLSAEGKTPSEGTTKMILAALVRHGILREGYRLPEWD